MKYQINRCSIGAYDSTPIASSEWLANTSNCVFTDWNIKSFFSIRDRKPFVHFEVTTKAFDGEVIFETNDFEELEKWINEHMEEISAQIKTKAETWLEENKGWLQSRLKPRSDIR